MKNLFRKKFIPVAHAGIIAGVYASPWFVPWPFIIGIFLLYHLQLKVFKGCILNWVQFGTMDETFNHYYLRKIYPKLDKIWLHRFTDYVLPISVLVTAIIIQQ